ncbi:hypothetical protein SLEP1_g22739 [Rubroshorea leprosula]|uniref:Retrotransposon gag domain-containing protein n=1 Tax=Rubroshorea leprosula TaxID=152421 RepID=A0AAV5JJI4_9ROSI|nr:hypothetical protein SLEP1_g22739 [Rubroshorea leprosula]
MSEEDTAINPKKSAMDEKVDKLEATMQTMATTLQTISLTLSTLSTLTTGLVPSPASLIPTIPIPPVPTITPASYPPFEMNNPTLPTTSPLTLNIPPLIGQVPTIQPNPLVAMLRPALEDGKSREVDHKLQQLKKALKAMQGPQAYGSTDLDDLCCYSDIQRNFKFKQPDFDKYDGLSYLYTHLQMYPRKMAPYANDERVLIHYFQDSLSGLASVWFSTLDKKKICTFKDVSQAFMKQYKFEAAKVMPPLTDNEICSLFIKSTTRTFRAWLAPCVGYTFTQLVTAGEQIEDVLKTGIIMDFQAIQKQLEQVKMGNVRSTSKKFAPGERKEDEEALNLIDEGKLQFDVNEAKSTPNITQNPLPLYDAGTMNMGALDEVEKPMLENASFSSLGEFITILTKYDLIQSIAQMSLNVSLAMIDDALVCPYHSNMTGHALRDCEDFQKKVKELQAMGFLKFVSAQVSEKCIAQFEDMGVEHITDKVCFDDEEDYFGFNNLFGLANIANLKEKWRRILAERAFMEKHLDFHLVHYAKAPMGSHESMPFESMKEESLCDSWGNLTMNALDEEKPKFDRGISLVNESSQANWTAKLLPVAFIPE